MRAEKFDFIQNVAGVGNSSFGQGHNLDLKPDIPFSTDKIHGIDLTHTIYSDMVAAKGGPGGPGGGGGGGGGGTTFAPYISGPANGTAGFDIKIEFIGSSWTQALHDVFVDAADQLTALIIGDLPNVSVRSKGKVTTVDDITITAELGNIDGLGGILGQAGPTSVRTNGSLPATASMQFDIVDVNAMGLAVFAEVILHEMAHSLGFGSIWCRLGLVTDGEFTGSNAVDEYHADGRNRLHSGRAGWRWGNRWLALGRRDVQQRIDDRLHRRRRQPVQQDERGVVRRPRLYACSELPRLGQHR